MKTISGFKFPETEEEVANWEPFFERIALHYRVLCVAKTRIEKAWNAYCVPVPGVNHDAEQELWEVEGSKIPESIARVMFPRFRELPYAR